MERKQKQNDLMDALLKGAYDLHTHPAPSAFPRALNDWELVQEAASAGMKGVLIKSHYGCTAARAASVNLANGSETRVYGALALNWPTGGLNPYAVENCLKQGGILIWMPTRDAQHCLAFGEMPGDFFQRPGITILQEDGSLKQEVYQIMDVVKQYGAYLATGHLSKEESILLCREGRRYGVNMILTHPEWIRTRVDGRTQAELAELGVVVEKNWINVADGTVSPEEMAANIRMTGVEHTYLATDRGQKGFEHPVEGMRRFLSLLLDQGFTEQELITMVQKVPAQIAAGETIK